MKNKKNDYRGKKQDHKPHQHKGKNPPKPSQKIKIKLAEGTISLTSKGVGYVEVEGLKDDVEIQNERLNTAYHGDKVAIEIGHPEGRENRIQGRVLKVLERRKDSFVGTTEKVGAGMCIIADDRKMYKFISLPDASDQKIPSGQKVLVKITNWFNKEKDGPEGKITKIIGTKGEHNAEMESILFEKGFETAFPAGVEDEAKRILAEEKNDWQNSLKDRHDFRGTWTCTIDPLDAKDFDDAISFKKLANGNYEIGVHIADVSHYVREGSALDKEARNRAFSVYLVDRTIPMLPEILSNDLCSLNPNEDKLSYSAVFEMTPNNKIITRWFGKTVMRSIKRFTYESAQDVLNKGSGEYFEELNALNVLAKKMRAEKYAAGAIDFERDEVRFELDSLGKPIRVYKKQRLDTHKLVEEYMLLANREVAQFIAKANDKKTPNGIFMYRVHGEPNQEKMLNLSVFLKALGFSFETKGKKITSKDIAKLLQKVEGSPQESLIKTAAIRSMAKAIYTTQNIGHFGLAFDYYTHFTSPIRRYPDLLVHRLLENHLKGGKMEQDAFTKYEEIASHSTEKEVAAAEAERGSIKYKQVEYMQGHVGEIFDGTISGVTEWGLYVEENETKCEGMIRLRDLKGDFYSLDEKNYRVIGQKTKKIYSLGDTIRFKVANADLDKKTLDYVPV